jgi:hypothetical protein
MQKIYWWTRVPDKTEYNKTHDSLKDELMYLINSQVTFKLTLYYSLDSDKTHYYLFSNETTLTDLLETGLRLCYFYKSYVIDKLFTLKEADLFDRRLTNAEYEIQVLTQEEFNKLIK